jgi:predicted nucleic-acid-binding protein
MNIVDANFILRYLLNDIEDQAKEAFSILNCCSITLMNEVIAEIVYVLEKVYKVDRIKICNELKDLIESSNIKVDNIDIMNYALDVFSKSRLDFIDSLLCAYAKIINATIYTFDKKLLNVIKEE